MHAPDAHPSQPLARWRFWAASCLIAAFAVLALWRALQEPSLGWRFGLGPDGTPQATRIHGEALTLHGVRALLANGQRVPVTPLLLVESAGLHNLYSDHDRFFAGHRALWEVMQGADVGIEHAEGVLVAPPQPKDLHELGVRFWYPWLVALLSMSVGLAVWIYRPGDHTARWYMLASVGYAFGMLCTAGWGSRLLTQDPQFWPGLHVLSHAASFLVVAGLCMVLWRHPTRLGGEWLQFVLAAACVGSVAADAFHWLPTISLTFRIPLVMLNVVMALLYLLQWRASRRDPLKRAQLKWLGLLLFMAFSVVFVAYAMGSIGYVLSTLPQNFGLSMPALIFLGLVPLVTRIGLFRLDRWWAVAWLWFLGGLLVVVLDVLLLALLPVSNENALVLALAIGGWLYFPLRQAIWTRLSRGSLPDTRDVLPDVVDIVTSAQADPARLNVLWRGLWDKVCQPQHLVAVEHEGAVGISGQGQSLLIPGWGGLQGLRLSLPERGRRLFNAGDVRRATEIVRLVQHGLASQESYERGVREERVRIASDLHDDLGAKLLTIAQSSAPGPAANLARQALDEMRLSLRDLAADAVPLADVLADWRSETVSRLTAAGFDAAWEATDPTPGMLLPARAHGQLTRILREAVSNAIRHSGGSQCRVSVALSERELTLMVQDDGSGMPSHGPSGRLGHGLPNIERRVRKLGGRHRFAQPDGGGTLLVVEVPLEER